MAEASKSGALNAFRELKEKLDAEAEARSEAAKASAEKRAIAERFFEEILRPSFEKIRSEFEAEGIQMRHSKAHPEGYETVRTIGQALVLPESLVRTRGNSHERPKPAYIDAAWHGSLVELSARASGNHVASASVPVSDTSATNLEKAVVEELLPKLFQALKDT